MIGDDFPGKSLQCGIAGSPASVDSDIPALGPPDLLEPIPECCDPGLSFLAVFGKRHQHADASNVLLRAPPRATRLARHSFLF